ncbi:MAG: hypothetical protein ACI9TH_000787 [Kiritimatiellia bacterium]|jgi:hypothetical protein
MQSRRNRRRLKAGFSLVEGLVSSIISVLLLAAAFSSLVFHLKGNQSGVVHNRHVSQGRSAIQRVVYGIDGHRGFREAHLANVQMGDLAPGWRVTIDDGEYMEYNASLGQILNHTGKVFVDGVVNSYVRWNDNSTGIQLGIVLQTAAFLGAQGKENEGTLQGKPEKQARPGDHREPVTCPSLPSQRGIDNAKRLVPRRKAFIYPTVRVITGSSASSAPVRAFPAAQVP